MSDPDWAKIYAAMDKRISLKYEQLPRGEQIGKSPPARNQDEKKPRSAGRAFLNFESPNA